MCPEFVYTWGDGAYGALGLGDALESQPVPSRVVPRTQQQDELPVLAGAAGSHHSFGVTVINGQYGVMAWGASAHGRLGLGDSTVGRVAVRGLGLGAFSRPQRCIRFDGFQVQQIACGSVHNVAITYGGVAWTWGDGAGGRLGTGTTSQVHTPMLIPAFKGKRVIKVCVVLCVCRSGGGGGGSVCVLVCVRVRVRACVCVCACARACECVWVVSGAECTNGCRVGSLTGLVRGTSTGGVRLVALCCHCARHG